MYKRPHNPNKVFMIGTMILAFAVILVVIFFTLLALRRISPSKDQPITYNDLYQIEIGNGFIGDSISIYLNDSLLLDSNIQTDTLRLSVTRFDETNALLVVDNATDKVTTFNLKDKGGRILLQKKEEVISITSVDWQQQE